MIDFRLHEQLGLPAVALEPRGKGPALLVERPGLQLTHGHDYRAAAMQRLMERAVAVRLVRIKTDDFVEIAQAYGLEIEYAADSADTFDHVFGQTEAGPVRRQRDCRQMAACGMAGDMQPPGVAAVV